MAKFSRFLKRLNNETVVKEAETQPEVKESFDDERYIETFKNKLGRIFGGNKDSDGEIDDMDKNELETYAYANFGIELDRRRTLKNMKKDFMDELKEQKGEQ